MRTSEKTCEPEQWLQRHPEAGSSWLSWPKASQCGYRCHVRGPDRVASSGQARRPSRARNLLWGVHCECALEGGPGIVLCGAHDAPQP